MKAIYLKGFKSFFNREKITLADITIFSGANSSGKSSAIQPILLMKQTIESQFDPGTLLLDGSNIKFTSLEQIISKGSGQPNNDTFSVELEQDDGLRLLVCYGKNDANIVDVKSTCITTPDGSQINFKVGTKFTSLETAQLEKLDYRSKSIRNVFAKEMKYTLAWDVVASRCFPDIRLIMRNGDDKNVVMNEFSRLDIQSKFRKEVSEIIHIQGLRGNPERTYSSTAKVAKNFPGVFTDYVASMLLKWQEKNDGSIDKLGNDLRRLGLSWKIKTKRVHDTQVEIRVGRLPGASQGGANDLVNLADVGLGVSQVLPFLVALRAAKKNQIVLVEQPEIHLHPKAQYELADIIIEAVNRGVKVWLETHSSSLLRAFQTKVAKSELNPKSLALNWFSRDINSGATKVTTAVVGPLGEYGKWPVDFDDVGMEIERNFLKAVADKAFSSRAK